MKLLRILLQNILVWILYWHKLLLELLWFITNFNRYLYQFFSGFRQFSNSYAGIITGLESLKKLSKNIQKSRLIEDDFRTLIQTTVDETVRLTKIHDEKYTGLFGLLIATLALFISVITLLITKH